MKKYCFDGCGHLAVSDCSWCGNNLSEFCRFARAEDVEEDDYRCLNCFWCYETAWIYWTVVSEKENPRIKPCCQKIIQKEIDKISTELEIFNTVMQIRWESEISAYYIRPLDVNPKRFRPLTFTSEARYFPSDESNLLHQICRKKEIRHFYILPDRIAFDKQRETAVTFTDLLSWFFGISGFAKIRYFVGPKREKQQHIVKRTRKSKK